MSHSPIYLDHHATTPLDPAVLEVMVPYLGEQAANPSSPHAAGRRANDAVEEAREHIAALVGASRGEVILTSGATEASNLAILGVLSGESRRRVITTAIEHPSVLAPMEQAALSGRQLVLVGVDEEGHVDLDQLARAVDRRTALVSVAAANGEIGAVQDLAAVAEIVRECGALLHVDAAQAVLTEELDMHFLGIDLLSLSAHKIYGPQGIGALVVRAGSRSRVKPIMFGGGQERNQRPGTTNLAGAVGFGAAARIVIADRPRMREHATALRSVLLGELESALGARLNGPTRGRLPINLNVRLPGVEADALIASCPQVLFSAGSACSSGTPGPSPVLTALGLTAEEAEESVRFAVGRFTTPDEIARAGTAIVASAGRIAGPASGLERVIA